MEDKKYFDIDEMMVDYAEMTSFDFDSSNYLAVSQEQVSLSEYTNQPPTFKYGNFDILDLLQSMFSKTRMGKA